MNGLVTIPDVSLGPARIDHGQIREPTTSEPIYESKSLVVEQFQPGEHQVWSLTQFYSVGFS